jgi:2'-hydroxyisoflavone reductase
VIKKAAALVDYSGTMIEATESWLIKHDVNYWAGARSLPLWLPWSEAAHGQRSNAAFRQARGKIRSIEVTLADTLEDDRRRGLGRERKSGLTRQGELDLLSELSR